MLGNTLAGVFGGAAGGNVVGGAIVRLLLDAAQFEKGLSSSEARLASSARRIQSIGNGIGRVGSGLTRNVTIPIVAAGAASVKMAIDFEGAITRIRANSNLSEKEIASLRTRVLELAGETAKSPRELAEGLYFLASAGLKANEVQEVLESSAKASASGFGEVGDIARLTANALNAYAKDGLRAKEVTDTLAAGIREGTAEPDEFANALGRILPIAQKAGVGFDEVVASLASLSTIGLDVNEGVTAMRGLMAGLFSPTNQSREALAEFNLTAEELRRTMAEDGLLAVLRLLEERTNGNVDALRKIVPNIRSMVGMFGITGQEADKVNASFRRVIGATDDLDRAFEKTRKDPGFKGRQLLAELQAIAIDIGEDALPVFKDAVEVVRDLLHIFQELPEPMQRNIVKWGLIAAAAGPVLRIFGGLVSVGGKLVGLLPRILGGLGGAAAAGGAGATGAGAAAAGGGGGLLGVLGTLARNPAGVVGGAAAIATAFPEGAPWDAGKRAAWAEALASQGMIRNLEEAKVRLAELDRQIESHGRTLMGASKAPEELQNKWATLNKAIEDFPLWRKEQFEGIKRSARALELLNGELSKSEQAHLEAALEANNFKEANRILNEALNEAAGKIEETRDGWQAWGSALPISRVQGLEEAIRRLPRDHSIRIDLIAQYGSIEAAAIALMGLRDALLAVGDARALNAPVYPGQSGGGSGGGGKKGGGGGGDTGGRVHPASLGFGSGTSRTLGYAAMASPATAARALGEAAIIEGDTISITVDARGSVTSAGEIEAAIDRVLARKGRMSTRIQRSRATFG